MSDKAIKYWLVETHKETQSTPMYAWIFYETSKHNICVWVRSFGVWRRKPIENGEFKPMQQWNNKSVTFKELTEAELWAEVL